MGRGGGHPGPRFPGGKKQFEKWVQEAIDSFPAAIQLRLENVAIVVEDEPPDAEEWGGELLGLYHGISRKDRGFWYGNVLPDRIVIYRQPLERISTSPEDLRENIRQTVVHEIGHYFGWEEEDLRRFEEEDR